MLILLLLLNYHVIDSLEYYYNLHTPDSLQMDAKCSIVSGVKFKVTFLKNSGLEVKSLSEEPEIGESIALDFIKWALLFTGLGLSEFWNSLGGVKFIDTLITKNKWITILPKDTTLFTKAELKIENWLIKEAKVKAEDKNIYARIVYTSNFPVNIEVKVNNSKFTIKYEYKDYNLRIPSKTEIFSDSPDIPDGWEHIIITYKQ